MPRNREEADLFFCSVTSLQKCETRTKKFNEVVDSLRKNITREYKAKLTKDQRKAFRSQMWAFRRDPESLSAEEKPALEALFEKIPALRPLYKVRLRFKEIFDTARDRITARAG